MGVLTFFKQALVAQGPVLQGADLVAVRVDVGHVAQDGNVLGGVEDLLHVGNGASGRQLEQALHPLGQAEGHDLAQGVGQILAAEVLQQHVQLEKIHVLDVRTGEVDGGHVGQGEDRRLSVRPVEQAAAQQPVPGGDPEKARQTLVRRDVGLLQDLQAGLEPVPLQALRKIIAAVFVVQGAGVVIVAGNMAFGDLLLKRPLTTEITDGT